MPILREKPPGRKMVDARWRRLLNLEAEGTSWAWMGSMKGTEWAEVLLWAAVSENFGVVALRWRGYRCRKHGIPKAMGDKKIFDSNKGLAYCAARCRPNHAELGRGGHECARRIPHWRPLESFTQKTTLYPLRMKRQIIIIHPKHCVHEPRKFTQYHNVNS